MSISEITGELIRYLPVAFIAKLLLECIVKYIQNRFSSDIELVPGPPVKRWWHLYTIGHNFVYEILFGDAASTADKFNSWRRTYGPTIIQIRSLFGERNILATSESAIRTVTITKNSSFVKPDLMRDYLAQIVGENGIILAEGDVHTRLLRAVIPSMRHESLSKVGDLFLEQGALLAERLERISSKGEDVLHDIRISTFSVILQTCFGKRSVPPHVMNSLQDAYLTVFSEPSRFELARILLQKLFWFAPRKFFGYREDLKRYIRDTVSQLCQDHKRRRAAGGCFEPSLLSLMVDQESKSTMSNQEMVEIVLSFLVAGQATTSLSVSWTLYLLAREQNWQRQLTDELEGWLPGDGLEALSQLPLLDRVVKESIRLYPPIFSAVRLTAESVVVDGYKLPKDTFVQIPVMALQRNEEIWGLDAREFNPDRFLREEDVARTRFYLCAFLFGPRSCIGQRFAILELKAFVAQVLKRLKVLMKPVEDAVPQCHGGFATPVGLKLYFQNK